MPTIAFAEYPHKGGLLMEIPINTRLMQQRRETKGWSQRELAAAAGVHPSVINRIERNLQDDLTVNVLLSIAKALDLTAEDLLNPSVAYSREQVAPELSSVYAEIVQLPSHYQRHIARLLRAYVAGLTLFDNGIENTPQE